MELIVVAQNITLMGTLKSGGTFEHADALVNGLFVASRLFCEVPIS